MSLTLPTETQRLIRRTCQLIDSAGYQRGIVENAIREAHEIAVASASSRVLTIPEIAALTGNSVAVIQRRVLASGVEPIKIVGGARLFAFEQVPAIITAHLDDTETLAYVPSRIRKAVKDVRSKRSGPVLRESPIVRFPDYNGPPAELRILLDRDERDRLRDERYQNGWPGEEEIVRALIRAYLRTEEEKR